MAGRRRLGVDDDGTILVPEDAGDTLRLALESGIDANSAPSSGKRDQAGDSAAAADGIPAAQEV